MTTTSEEGEKFQFYGRSADKPPGAGVGDVIHNKAKYKELCGIKNWRRMFSDLWVSPRTVDWNPWYNAKLTYRTRHHAYQSAKAICNGHDGKAFKYAIESGTELALVKGGNDARREGRKYKPTKEQEEAWRRERQWVKRKLYFTWYTTGVECVALRATGDVKLINNGPRIRKVACKNLMLIRSLLKDPKKLEAHRKLLEQEGKELVSE